MTTLDDLIAQSTRRMNAQIEAEAEASRAAEEAKKDAAVNTLRTYLRAALPLAYDHFEWEFKLQQGWKNMYIADAEFTHDGIRCFIDADWRPDYVLRGARVNVYPQFQSRKCRDAQYAPISFYVNCDQSILTGFEDRLLSAIGSLRELRAQDAAQLGVELAQAKAQAARDEAVRNRQREEEADIALIHSLLAAQVECDVAAAQAHLWRWPDDFVLYLNHVRWATGVCNDAYGDQQVEYSEAWTTATPGSFIFAPGSNGRPPTITLTVANYPVWQTHSFTSIESLPPELTERGYCVIKGIGEIWRALPTQDRDYGPLYITDNEREVTCFTGLIPTEWLRAVIDKRSGRTVHDPA